MVKQVLMVYNEYKVYLEAKDILTTTPGKFYLEYYKYLFKIKSESLKKGYDFNLDFYLGLMRFYKEEIVEMDGKKYVYLGFDLDKDNKMILDKLECGVVGKKQPKPVVGNFLRRYVEGVV